MITVIVATLVLVTAGYSNEQIAPAFGLFGTIVGYILGRMSQPAQPVDLDLPVKPTPAAALQSLQENHGGAYPAVVREQN